MNMSQLPESSKSIWMSTAAVPPFAPLLEHVVADVCVIGAGIAGLTSAYLLAKEGKSVVVIDAIGVGAGETGRTTAHFMPPDDRYFEIETGFGADSAKLVAESFQAATDLVEAIVRNEQIDCEFERLDGYLFSPDGKDRETIEKEYAAAGKARVRVGMVEQVPGLSFDTGPAIRFQNQAQFHPLKYLAGLAASIVRKGGRIYGQTRALSIKGDDRQKIVHTGAAEIKAGAVIVATNTPFNDSTVMHTKQAGYMSYVIGIQVPKGSVPRILLWDTGDPYYYVRLETLDPQAQHEILVVGGVDHKVGQDEHPEHRYDELETWVRERYPMAAQVEYRWCGIVMEPADGVAFLGRNPADDKNVYIITGDSGTGMTHCTAGAMLVTDLINGRSNPWSALYAPSRKPFHGLSEFVKEQVNVMAQYGDWLSGGEVDSVTEIKPGDGAIMRAGTTKLAVYRDAQGELAVLSAVCTHLGCIVGWNSAEKTWDCPCHASRFNVNGAVIHGPAVKPLAAAELPK
jgi:glycine/D-amino acid oxidase-like deaminating enzyme/nitrite reductase/ring-hydroxylating ferredoxin subunit